MKKLIFAILIIATNSVKAQQEPHYTQNQFNSNLLLNPAYAGTDQEYSNIGVRYRNQWTGFDGAPTTASIIADTKFKSLGIGFSLNHDVIGIEKSITADLNLSYHIKVTEHGNFSFGLKGGYQSIKADFTKLVNVNPTDPLYTTANGKLAYPFIGLGLLYYTPKFYLGASMPRMGFDKATAVRHKYSEAHYYLYGGLRIPLENEIEFRPALLTKFQPKAPVEFDFALDTWYKKVVGFGVGYRTGDAVNFMVKTQLKNVYLGYSYDMNITKLNHFNGGSHEVFLGLKIPHKKIEDDQDRNQNGRYF